MKPVLAGAVAPASATDRPLVRLFAPLAAAALLAALAGPVVNHGLAATAEPTPALAGFWLGWSLLLLLEAACFVWQPTSLAFLEEPRARRRLGLLALGTGLATSALVRLAGEPAVAGWIFRVLVPTSDAAARVAAGVLRALSPLPAIVAVRGVLAASVLRDGRGAAIPAALLARLAVLAAWPLAFRAAGPAAACDALLAAGAVELGVLVLSRAASRPHAPHVVPPAARRVAAVAAPLVVSALAWAALRPALHAVLGRLALADVAQARFGLVFAVFMTLCAPVWSLRDLAVLAEGLGAPRASVRRLSWRVAAAASAGFAVFLAAATASGSVRAAFGFTPATGAFAGGALALLALAPPLVAARMPAQGALIARHRTAVFAWVPGLRLALTAACGLALAHARPDLDGAWLGAALLLAGEVFEAWAYGRAAAAALAPAGTPTAPAAPAEPPARVA